MLNEVSIVTDLGPGDGGKGKVVNVFCNEDNISLVIKRGGAQGSHGVRCSNGEKFNFSQWGCGTFEAIPTFLSPQFIVMPVGLINESEALERKGIINPFRLLSCDPDCICATPFHWISSRLSELLRGKNPRGTIGTGVGQAYRMFQQSGDEMTIRARELTDHNKIADKLFAQLKFYRACYQYKPENYLDEDAEHVAECFDLLNDDGFLDYNINEFEKVGQMLSITSLSEAINNHDGSAVIECSHGVLTDAVEGFKPHTSAIRTLPKFTEEMMRNAGFTGRIRHYAVHRAYEIRHGAGPMSTYDPEFTKHMLPDSHKANNRWQGEVRAGPLDINLIQHALAACKDTSFDGLCLTWFDQILEMGSWKINDDIIPIDSKLTGIDLWRFVENIIDSRIGLSLELLSIGPTERDRLRAQDFI
ncbi:adenylosuccinate synthetase [Candidatus Saccharibacteria bacterium]|nr:adenylosuccinate synthetase [Candidatus Saccharibacteria bacterium]